MNSLTDGDKLSKKRNFSKYPYHLAPVFVLLILTPLISELLLGDIALNASFPMILILDLSYYGTGAIVIREIVRRRGLPWSWVPILAFAYGLIEEGLVLHSLFNSHFPGIGGLGFYGHALGVNWVWASFVLGLHTVWSITVPILITELLFPTYQRVRWLGHVGFFTTCAIFVLALTFLGLIYATYITPGFAPSPIALICTTLLILAILALTLFVPIKPRTPETDLRNAPNP